MESRAASPDSSFFVITAALAEDRLRCYQNALNKKIRESVSNTVRSIKQVLEMVQSQPQASDTELRIAEIVISELKLEEVTPETFDPELDLVDELGIDSMDLTTVVLMLQDDFGITIDEDDYPKLKNIRAIAGYIQSRTD